MKIEGPQAPTAQHDVAAFSCGHPALDRWLHTRALSHQQKGFTAVVVVHVQGRVVGFYGLWPTAVLPAQLLRSIRTGQPSDPVPCLLLGRPGRRHGAGQACPAAQCGGRPADRLIGERALHGSCGGLCCGGVLGAAGLHRVTR